uniref:Mutator-like transposase domain-containing protein n=1 Tax=Magallana gigas TaxID=29159 RepID=K1QP80_MAGGI
MSKAKYGKKVVKTVVSHRICGTCKWWQRNRPGQEIRKHRCVHNHTGSARLMESVSGVQGIKELIDLWTFLKEMETIQ